MKVIKKTTNHNATPAPTSAEEQVGQAYVRVTKIDNHGFVEFQFSIGDPNLYLEMALPRPAFDEFCATQNARHLSEEQERLVDQTELKWRYGDVGKDEHAFENGS